MKLLLDANLSPRLIARLADLYPNSTHVFDSPCPIDDEGIWRFAGEHGYLIVTKDSDFHRLSLVRGPPPKVVWLRIGNAGTDAITELLLRSATLVRGLAADSDAAFLILAPTGT